MLSISVGRVDIDAKFNDVKITVRAHADEVTIAVDGETVVILEHCADIRLDNQSKDMATRALSLRRR